MLVPALKQVAYDPARYLDIETVDEAVNIILCPTEGMTAKQRWTDEAPALMRILEEHIAPKSAVLDYGCGIGRMAKPLIEKLGCQVVGIDISPNMRALAASLVDSPAFFAIDPMMFDTIKPSWFDAAISVWTLQHCIDVDMAIRRIGDALKTGGTLTVLNNITRCIPVDGGEWADDGVDVNELILSSGFSEIERGVLDESVAPGWMQKDTFWAVYRRWR
jgi:SAM-dependent methyltransferase